MNSRGNLPYGGRSSVQPPGMMRHGPFPAGHRSTEPHRPELQENKFEIQEAEIERLVCDNHRLASTQVALREDLVASQQDIERLRAHIRSIQTESDIQIRVLLDKIAKMEVDIRRGESVKKELKEAHFEARSLVAARQELSVQIQEAKRELEKTRIGVKKVPEMHEELDSLRQEHQKLRSTFEYEKGLNMGKVEEMQEMEKDLLAMARQVEKLRSEVLNAENKAHAPNPYPYGGPYMNPDPAYPPLMRGGGCYVDSYGRLVHIGGGGAGEGMIPFGSGVGGAPPPNTGGNPMWGGAYDGPHVPR
ncbi:hypothetical protein LguiA_011049 [Lonicera macranthoides]